MIESTRLTFGNARLPTIPYSLLVRFDLLPRLRLPVADLVSRLPHTHLRFKRDGNGAVLTPKAHDDSAERNISRLSCPGLPKDSSGSEPRHRTDRVCLLSITVGRAKPGLLRGIVITNAWTQPLNSAIVTAVSVGDLDHCNPACGGCGW